MAPKEDSGTKSRMQVHYEFYYFRYADRHVREKKNLVRRLGLNPSPGESW